MEKCSARSVPVESYSQVIGKQVVEIIKVGI
jgi:hypothetical protein